MSAATRAGGASPQLIDNDSGQVARPQQRLFAVAPRRASPCASSPPPRRCPACGQAERQAGGVSAKLPGRAGRVYARHARARVRAQARSHLFMSQVLCELGVARGWLVPKAADSSRLRLLHRDGQTVVVRACTAMNGLFAVAVHIVQRVPLRPCTLLATVATAACQGARHR